MAIEKIDLNNLDKSDWKTYRFDEIAQNISERVDPNNTDLEVYIGLEHIDSESLHIKRHGTPNDVNGTKLKFYKGDIIFGRRRAYQRKAGIATCDGFCSAHALVLRANPEVIDPRLFPFFIHSDLFMNRAVDISVGSLSPTINWGTLKHQEFILPTVEQQASFSDLLMSSNESYEKGLYLVEAIKSSEKIVVTQLIKEIAQSNPVMKLGDLVDITTGKLDSNASVEHGKYPFFTCAPNTLKIDRFSFDCEALLLAGNNAAGVYPLKYYKGKFDAYQRTYVITIKDTQKICYSYLLENIKTQLDLLKRLSVGSSTKFLTIKVLKNLKIPVATMGEQLEFIDKMNCLYDSMDLCKVSLNCSKSVKDLLNYKVFEICHSLN